MALSKESFLPDEDDCAETWRQLRWPDGPKCPECGSAEIQIRQENHRDCFHRYCCRKCERWFTDTTGTFLEASNVSLSRWVYLIREMDKKRSINDIAKDLDLTYKTVLGMSHKVKEAIYDRREEWLDALTGEVEADDVHVKGGQQGREVSEEENGRTARTRGLSERGRGSYEGDRPLVVSWIERGEKGPRVFELRRTAGKKSLLSSALSHVEEGAAVDTDTWSGYQLLEEIYDHRQVKHSEQYVSEEGAHCNTAESEWSVFKPWWRTFRGLAKRNLYLYLSEHSFRRSHRHLSRKERIEAVMSLLSFLWLRPSRPMRVRVRTANLGDCCYVHYSS